MGVKLHDTMERRGTGEFPLIEDIDTEGGCQVCSTSLSEVKYRKVGMLASVASTGQVWKLTALPDTWSELFAGDFVAGSDLSGSSTAQTVVGIQGSAVSNAAPADGDVLIWNTDLSQWEPQEPPAGFSAGGDLSGTATSQTVVAIQNNAVSDAAPSSDDVLTWNSVASQWEPKVSGGGSGYTESVYIADPNIWIDTGDTLPAARRYMQFFIVGNTLYLYGGLDLSNNGTSTIWSAPITDPTDVTDTESTLPYARGAPICKVGNYLYMFGVLDGSTSRILQASTSDPTAWSNTGYTIPNNQVDIFPVIIGNNIYAYGGAISGNSTNKIISASTSDPLAWSDTGKTLPIALDLGCIFVINDKIYLFSGWNPTGNSSGIYFGNITDPTKIVTYSKTFPIAYSGCSNFSVDNSLYVVGGDNAGTATSAVHSSFKFPPYFMEVNPIGLPIGIASITGNNIIIDGYCYLYGGRTGSSGCINKIHRSKNRIQAMAQSETQAYLAQKAIFPDGGECEYSVHQKSGVPPWQIDTYAPRTTFV